MIGCMSWIHHLYYGAIFTASWVFLAGIVLMILPRCGPAARALCEVLARAPALDGVMSLLTWVPWVLAWLIGGLAALAGSVAGGAVGLVVWCLVHEMIHLSDWRGPRIVKSLNRLVGRPRNHGALWVTTLALPGFFLVRLHEYLAYPVLVWLLGFPRYDMGQWVNVSRQKFSGLVGHDLVWCLYCDWMTGLYSLGAEMLRNVESFWCPIRFYDGKKCENCRQDFPDLENGWVPPDGTMGDVAALIESKYASVPRAWFGHPARLTVNGQPTISSQAAAGGVDTQSGSP